MAGWSFRWIGWSSVGRRVGWDTQPLPNGDTEELLMERADAGWRLLRSEEGKGTDPYEVLAAIVWPDKEMIEAQVEARLARKNAAA